RPPALPILDRLNTAPGRIKHRVADRLPPRATEEDCLTFKVLDALRFLPLPEGDVEHVAAPHVEDGDTWYPLLQPEGEYLSGGIVPVALAPARGSIPQGRDGQCRTVAGPRV